MNKGGELIDIFSDKSFSFFKRVLDSEMKELQAAGIGVSVKQADPIRTSHEEQLWDNGLLGDQTPAILLDTMVFLSGLNFALQSGHKYCHLNPDMLLLFEPTDGHAYLQYTEHGSKNNPGGLPQHGLETKTARAYANLQDPLYGFTNTTCLFDHMVHLMMPSICSLCVPGHMGIGINVSQLDIIHL